MDSKTVAKVIDSGIMRDKQGYDLIKKIQKCMKLHKEVKVFHKYREANLCANLLTKTRLKNMQPRML